MAQAFVGVFRKVYKMAASKTTPNEDLLSKTNVWFRQMFIPLRAFIEDNYEL